MRAKSKGIFYLSHIYFEQPLPGLHCELLHVTAVKECTARVDCANSFDFRSDSYRSDSPNPSSSLLSDFRPKHFFYTAGFLLNKGSYLPCSVHVVVKRRKANSTQR